MRIGVALLVLALGKAPSWDIARQAAAGVISVQGVRLVVVVAAHSSSWYPHVVPSASFSPLMATILVELATSFIFGWVNAASVSMGAFTVMPLHVSSWQSLDQAN